MTGWKDWTVGEVVTEPDFQSYIQNQVVQNYASSAARGSALGTAVSEGMVAYLQDTNALELYTGASWTPVSAGAGISAITAGTGLTGGGTAGTVTVAVNFTDVQARITGGTAGQAFISNGTASPGFGNVGAEYITTTVNTLAATATAYTTTAADENDIIYSLATATCTITVPDLILVGDRIDIVRDGAGTVVIAAGTGVTSWAGNGTAGTAVTFKIDQQYNAATVMKVAANTYRVIGRIVV
jgi:hypothetical protein